MVLLGIGAGIAFNPVLLAAMGDVEPHEAGLASGVVNTSFMMGGALGLAVLVALSDWRHADLVAGGTAQLEALNGGYQLAFAAGAVMAASAQRSSAAPCSAPSRCRSPTARKQSSPQPDAMRPYGLAAQ